MQVVCAAIATYAFSVNAASTSLSTDTAKSQDDAVVLLQQDLARFRREHLGDSAATDAAFLTQFKSHIASAGGMNNAKARPILWEIAETVPDRQAAQMAIASLGKMGRPEDLERLIAMIKKNPSLPFSFYYFGPQTGPRLMKEFDDPALPENVQARFAGGICDSISRDSIPTYLPLLRSKNEFLAREVAHGIGTRLRPEDSTVLREMLANANLEVRSEAIAALDLNAWSDSNVPMLLNVLKNDSSYINRITAANVLGHHKVKAAIPALTSALNDSDSTVRAGARSALQKIGSAN